jgi:peroxiredoxin
MKYRTLLSITAAATMFATLPMAASATPDIGKPAPAFSGSDSRGKAISLGDFRGKTVVLEWTNHDCPYVRKHYSVDNMQKLQRSAAKDGIVWLQVISSAPGLEGHVAGDQAEALNTTRKAAPSGIVLDPKGTIGRQYAARHTPTMVVIDPKGTLAYYGAIDDDSNWHPDSIKGAKNHVRAALADLKAGRAVSVAKTRAYGCSVKYMN